MAGRMPNIKNLHETKETFSDLALGMCALMAAHAQDNDFDLGSQRSEVQLVNPVPGKKIDHQGLVINPTPRYVKLTGEGTVDISGGVKLEQPMPARISFGTIGGILTSFPVLIRDSR